MTKQNLNELEKELYDVRSQIHDLKLKIKSTFNSKLKIELEENLEILRKKRTRLQDKIKGKKYRGKEYWKKYYSNEKHREQLKKRQKKYREKNKEKLKKYHREYYKKNRDKFVGKKIKFNN